MARARVGRLPSSGYSAIPTSGGGSYFGISARADCRAARRASIHPVPQCPWPDIADIEGPSTASHLLEGPRAAQVPPELPKWSFRIPLRP